jgi:hypothetical protein
MRDIVSRYTHRMPGFSFTGTQKCPQKYHYSLSICVAISTLKLEVTRSTETSIITYKATKRHNAGNNHIPRCRQTVNSHIYLKIYSHLSECATAHSSEQNSLMEMFVAIISRIISTTGLTLHTAGHFNERHLTLTVSATYKCHLGRVAQSV